MKSGLAVPDAGSGKMIVPQDIQINLLNYKIGSALQRKKQMMQTAVLSAVIILSLLVMVVSYVLHLEQLSQLKEVNASLRDGLAQEDAVLSSLQADQKITDKLAGKRQLIQKIEKERVFYSQLFQLLDKMNIAGVYITNINAQSGLLVFQGYSEGQNSISDLTAWLRQQSCFGEVKDLSCVCNPDSGETQFSLSISWKGVSP